MKALQSDKGGEARERIKNMFTIEKREEDLLSPKTILSQFFRVCSSRNVHQVVLSQLHLALREVTWQKYHLLIALPNRILSEDFAREMITNN